MKGKIVAFTGKRGSGKSTASKLLISIGYREYSFAEPVKNMLRSLYRDFGVDDDTIERYLNGDLKEVPVEFLDGKPTRHAMQTLGTEWRELISTRLWARRLSREVRASRDERVVVSDLRFPHEYHELDEIPSYELTVVRLTRFGNDDVYDEHSSETLGETLPANFEIDNTGDILDLACKLAAIGLFDISEFDVSELSME